MWNLKSMGERSTFWFLFFTSVIFAAAAKKANRRLPRILITSLLQGNHFLQNPENYSDVSTFF